MTTLALIGLSSAESRWARFGAYYAMFPIEFADDIVSTMSEENGTVIDPFCGRGTAPYIAMITGRRSIGCDINPVAWLYAAAKTDPHPNPADLITRLAEIQDLATEEDTAPENEFQKLAFGKRALSFINSARRNLQWRENSVDRTLAAVMTHFLHAKLGQGLSNQLRHSRALSPQYSIRWWKDKGLGVPPDIDPVAFLTKRIAWRYQKGLPKHADGTRARILLGDAADELAKQNAEADLILTSPPYCGVINYRTDNWLRLWALNEGPALVKWDSDQKFTDSIKYADMLRRVMSATKKQAKASATWYLRIDARQRTKTIVVEVMKELLPDYRCTEKAAPFKNKTQTALYGDSRPKPGEIDLIYQPS